MSNLMRKSSSHSRAATSKRGELIIHFRKSRHHGKTHLHLDLYN